VGCLLGVLFGRGLRWAHDGRLTRAAYRLPQAPDSGLGGRGRTWRAAWRQAVAVEDGRWQTARRIQRAAGRSFDDRPPTARCGQVGFNPRLKTVRLFEKDTRLGMVGPCIWISPVAPCFWHPERGATDHSGALRRGRAT